MILNEDEINEKLEHLKQQVGREVFASLVEKFDVEYKLAINEFVNENKYFLTMHSIACMQAYSRDNFLNISNFQPIIIVATSLLEHHKKLCLDEKNYFEKQA